MHAQPVPLSAVRIVGRITLVLGLATLAGLAGCGSERAEREVIPRESGDVAGASSARTERGGSDNQAAPVVLFLGTSLTAGYGLDDPDLAFPALVEGRIDSLGLDFQVVNGGVSGDTSAGGLERLPFLLDRPIRVLVLEMGANDGLRGLDTEALEANLARIIEETRAKNPDVEIVLAGMEAPPNLGVRYTDRFRAVFTDVARSESTEFIPFLLDGVAGVPDLNQSDRIHPTAEGHRVVFETVWASLGPLLQALDRAR